MCRAGKKSGGGAAAGNCGGFWQTLVHTSVQHDGLHQQDQGEPFSTVTAVTEATGKNMQRTKKSEGAGM